MKRLSLTFFVLAWISESPSYSQVSPPPIEWQASYGGTGFDGPIGAIRQTADGGFILGNGSASRPSDPTDPATGNKTSPNYGNPDSWPDGSDFWVVRVDGKGAILWDKSFGGSGADEVGAIVESGDGGFLIGGTSGSRNNGNKTAPSFGGLDIWIVRTDAAGTKLWDKAFGGTGEDRGFASSVIGDQVGLARIAALGLLPTSDGGWVLAGSSSSAPGGNKTAPRYGGSDFWLVRLDQDFNILWDRSYGGTRTDDFHSMVATADGGFILAGRSISGIHANGAKMTANFGQSDIWVLRVDASGAPVWDVSLGGSDHDGEFTRVGLTPDGGIVVASSSRSPEGSGNKTSSNFPGVDPCSDQFVPLLCAFDYWIVRLDANGTKIWDKSFGGTDEDRTHGGFAMTADGGIIVGGVTRSDAGTGNKISPFYGTLPNRDGWVVRLDANGNKLWDETYGTASGGERVQSLIQAEDGGFVLAGMSTGWEGDGNKTSLLFGDRDYWLIKLGPEFARLNVPRQSSQEIQQNGFRLTFVGGQVNGSYVFESSTDLIQWQPFQTDLFTGPPLEVLDSDAKASNGRFYRARSE